MLGSIMKRGSYKIQNPLERLLSKVQVNTATQCWIWTGCLDQHGYGRFNIRGVTSKAHRWSFILHGKVISQGLELDHLCRTPACVNPEHLEPVTHRENMLRGVGVGAKNAKKTHCVNGHEFNFKNTYYRSGRHGRHCRVCNRIRMRDYYRRKTQ